MAFGWSKTSVTESNLQSIAQPIVTKAYIESLLASVFDDIDRKIYGTVQRFNP